MFEYFFPIFAMNFLTNMIKDGIYLVRISNVFIQVVWYRRNLLNGMKMKNTINLCHIKRGRLILLKSFILRILRSKIACDLWLRSDPDNEHGVQERNWLSSELNKVIETNMYKMYH